MNNTSASGLPLGTTFWWPCDRYTRSLEAPRPDRVAHLHPRDVSLAITSPIGKPLLISSHSRGSTVCASGCSGAPRELREGGPLRIPTVIRAVWPRWWLALAALSVGWFAASILLWPTPELSSLAGPLPETRFLAAGESVRAFLMQLGPAGRQLYAAQQVIDLAFIALYVPALLVGIRCAASLTWRSGLPWLVALPVLAGVTDVSEDACLLVMIAAFPDEAPLLRSFMGILATVKVLLFGISVVSLAILGIWAIRNESRGTARATTDESPSIPTP